MFSFNPLQTSFSDSKQSHQNSSSHSDVVAKKSSHSSKQQSSSSVLTIPKLLDPSLQQLSAMGVSQHYLAGANSVMPLTNGYEMSNSTGKSSDINTRGLKRDHCGNDKMQSSAASSTAINMPSGSRSVMNDMKSNSKASSLSSTMEQSDVDRSNVSSYRKENRTASQAACDLIVPVPVSVPVPVPVRSKLDLCEPKWLLTDAEDDNVDELCPGERRRHQLTLIVNGVPPKSPPTLAKASFMADLKLLTTSQLKGKYH